MEMFRLMMYSNFCMNSFLKIFIDNHKYSEILLEIVLLGIQFYIKILETLIKLEIVLCLNSIKICKVSDQLWPNNQDNLKYDNNRIFRKFMAD